jgi:signal transduction histidine kinase
MVPVRVDIVFDEPADELMLLIDPLHFQQIIINLGINSGDAMQTGGQVKITADLVDVEDALCRITQKRVSGRWLRIGVADNGSGIDESLIEDIFQPFVTTKEVGKGSGMGLAVVAGLVGGYGGHILVSSEPRSGTAFSLLFPMVDLVG